MQIMKLTQKWVFDGQTRPKRHGILKTTFGLKLGEPVEREEEKKEEEEEMKRKKMEIKQAQGMDALILVWNYMVLYGFLVQIYVCGLRVVGNLTLE